MSTNPSHDFSPTTPFSDSCSDCDFCSLQSKYTHRENNPSQHFFTQEPGAVLVLQPEKTPLSGILPQWATIPDEQQVWPSLQYIKEHWTQTPQEQKVYDHAKLLAQFEKTKDNKKRNAGRELIREVDDNTDSQTLDFIWQMHAAESEYVAQQKQHEQYHQTQMPLYTKETQHTWMNSPEGVAWRNRAAELRRMGPVMPPMQNQRGYNFRMHH
jgi:hypothetical protein